MVKKFSLGEKEKIKKNSLIKKIIYHGSKYQTEIFDCFYTYGESNKIAVVIPKKKIKLATDRNFLKRRMRESYRLNKLLLSKKIFNIILIYKIKEKKSFQEIEICMIDLFLHLDALI